MKFSVNWLKEIIGFTIDTNRLVEQLTTIGLEVSAVTSHAANFTGVVVGKIIETAPHPDANKLTICKVSLGNDEVLNIVCGAPNARLGIKVAVATVGAKLPGGFKIKKAKLRGVESEGMLCSFRELGLPATGDGIIELADDAPLGVAVEHYLQLNDEVIDIDLTINRGDCLSILGIAREVAAVQGTKILPPEIPKITSSTSAKVKLVVKAPVACPHYCGRVIKGVNNKIATPHWMKLRLERSGVNSINFVVDVTNYVMLLLGQPLHAFDLAKMGQELQIRLAAANEEIRLLDGNTLVLEERSLVIADANQPLVLAGVMGGIDSGVNAASIDIFLESAFFSREQVAMQSQYYNIKTDSSNRFERGVDYKLQRKALDLATSLIIKMAGGFAGEVEEFISNEHLPKNHSIILKKSAITEVLGMAIDDQEVVNILKCLEIGIEVIEDGWQVQVPSFRFDLNIAEDLIEELIRIRGYDSIPESGIICNLSNSHLHSPNNREMLRRIYYMLEDMGYHEAITYDFIDEQLQKLFDPDLPPLMVSNPIASDLGAMRTSLFPGLISVAKYNLHRKHQRNRLFEVGLKFIPTAYGLKQDLVLAGVTCGSVYTEQWSEHRKHSQDFFDIKNDVEKIVRLFRESGELSYRPIIYPAFHPKQAAQVVAKDSVLGLLGQLHPSIAQVLGITGEVFIFEIFLSKLIKMLDYTFKPFSKFPSVTRDIAVIVGKDISWGQIRDKIVDIAGKLLQNVTLFDIYTHSSMGTDKHSFAIRLVFQSIERTLVDSEVEELVGRIVGTLKSDFAISLRV